MDQMYQIIFEPSNLSSFISYLFVFCPHKAASDTEKICDVINAAQFPHQQWMSLQ